MAFAPFAVSLLLAAGSPPKAPATAPAKAPLAFPFPTEVHALPNGLRVVLVPYDSPGLVAYYTVMRVGSRNEPEPGKSGFAHFFEHMMFKGTKTHPAAEYNDTITKLGLDANASTDFDLTLYHLYGPAKALPTIIAYEADRFQHLEYADAEFRTEAGAILGEYAKSASNPEEKLTEAMLETAFTKHTYGHTVIGYKADVDAMPSGFEYSREFFRRYYTPDNATIVIVGDFDRAATLQQIEAAYGPWKGKVDPARIAPEPRQTQSKRVAVPWPTPVLPRLWIAWHTPGSSDLKAAAVQNLLDGYLFGPTSALYQKLVLGDQIVESMEGTYSEHRDPFLFGPLLRVKDPKNLQRAEQAVLREVSNLARGKVDAARLEAVRQNAQYGNILNLNKADALAGTLAFGIAQTGDVQFVNKLHAEISRVRPADCVEFAKRYMLDSNRTTATLTATGPRKTAGAGKGGAR